MAILLTSSVSRDQAPVEANFAQKNFANAKSISSSQVHGSTNNSGGGSRQAAQRFGNATAISSAQFYGRDESHLRRTGGGGFSTDLVEELVNVDLTALGEGVLEVGSKLADYASDLFLQGSSDW